MILLTFAVVFMLISSGIYFFQERLIFFPAVLPSNYQYQFDNNFEEVNYRVEEDVSINALYFKVEKPKGIVFYSHGNAGNLSGWGNVADVFIKNKFDVLIYDYRGYGKSTGSVSESNLYRDAMYIYEQLTIEYEEDKIVVYGRSIGTGIATKVASEFNPKHLVLESPYYNLPDLARKMFPFIPSFMLRYKFRIDQMIDDVKCPVTVFHGTFDEVIYYGSSLKLEKLLKNDDKLVQVTGGHHNDLINFGIFHDELANILK